MPRRFASLALIGAATMLLAACNFSANLTVSPETLEQQAFDALEAEYGTTPALDCGNDQIDLVDGAVVECGLTFEGAEYDALITISNVQGTSYNINVEVPGWDGGVGGASEPSATPTETQEPAPSSEAAGGESVSVYPYELAALAADALEPEYGARPTVVCNDESQIEIFAGTTLECDLIEAKTGAKGIATITVTSVEGNKYSIDVNVVDA
ncbi:DUF4333 domain-containing protein [Humidisolicoccus flavus]|uniref:DUF4333 domain-containing protein n=1 Tax=Humidisolicoccus flavus TaxID=3111414 RepID=UPI0032565F56